MVDGFLTLGEIMQTTWSCSKCDYIDGKKGYIKCPACGSTTFNIDTSPYSVSSSSSKVIGFVQRDYEILESLTIKYVLDIAVLEKENKELKMNLREVNELLEYKNDKIEKLTLLTKTN